MQASVRPESLWFALVCGIAAASAAAQTQMFLQRGLGTNRHLGTSVGVAGDVNLDGIADIICGAPSTGWASGGSASGSVRVFSGKDGAVLYRFVGDTVDDYFGISVSGAGDVDGDGWADLVVGAMYDDNTGNQSGSVRVFSGRTGNIVYTRDGDAAGDYLGQSVSGAGDVNGDGHDDFVAGASVNISAAQRGYARVYSGRDGSTLYTFTGDSAGDRLGFSVSGAGDVDNDGFADVVVGATLDDNNGNQSGSVRVYSGQTGGILFTFDGDSGGDELGSSVSGAGDVDQDGFADVIAGAWKDDNNGTESGSARVYSGRTGNVLFTFDGDAAGDIFGVAVHGAGDADGDGFPDFVVGASSASSRGAKTGIARVLSGRDGSTLFTVGGITADDNFGIAVSGGADFNCDGFSDVVVGAPNEIDPRPQPMSYNAGTMRVFSGRELSFRSDVSTLPLTAAGRQDLTLDAGATHANRSYWIFGSITGVKPGITLGGVHIPLVPDFYTDLALGLPMPFYVGFRGTLSATGTATASFDVPTGLPALTGGTLFHAFVVHDAQGRFYFASNAVPLRLTQ